MKVFILTPDGEPRKEFKRDQWFENQDGLPRQFNRDRNPEATLQPLRLTTIDLPDAPAGYEYEQPVTYSVYGMSAPPVVSAPLVRFPLRKVEPPKRSAAEIVADLEAAADDSVLFAKFDKLLAELRDAIK